jgi:hypothetical protein
MKLGTHMPGGERRKPINIEDRNTKVKVTTIRKLNNNNSNDVYCNNLGT